MIETTRDLDAAFARLLSLDSESDSFSRDHAYYCSVISEAAYYNVSQREKFKDDRFNVWRSEVYAEAILKERIRSQGPLDDIEPREFRFSGGNVEFENEELHSLYEEMRQTSFVEETPELIILVVLIRRSVFVSIRGTHELSDWYVNLMTAMTYWKSEPSNFNRKRETLYAHFHTGFYRVAKNGFEKLKTRLLRSGGADPTWRVYFTGHSLGGAVAAIMTTLFNHDFNLGHFGNSVSGKMALCYTFGAPKYSDLKAKEFSTNCFHIIDPADAVPHLPLTLGRYRLVGELYYLEEGANGATLHSPSSFDWLRTPWWITPVSAIRAHSMQLYKGRLLRLTI